MNAHYTETSTIISHKITLMNVHYALTSTIIYHNITLMNAHYAVTLTITSHKTTIMNARYAFNSTIKYHSITNHNKRFFALTSTLIQSQAWIEHLITKLYIIRYEIYCLIKNRLGRNEWYWFSSVEKNVLVYKYYDNLLPHVRVKYCF